MTCTDDVVINVNAVSKFFEIYEKPSHRLLQTLYRGKKQFYRPFWAVRDISFTVRKGECVGIIGRNGAGKSTLLQIVTGTLSPSSGEITVKGRVAALLELGSGFNPEFTGRENVYMNAAILGLSKAEIDARYNDIVAFADIGDFLAQPVKSYSSGMVVRLAFAVVAHVDADVLIVDEALSVGDAFFTQKCMRFLRHFMETNTVLFVSHDIAAVNSLCNKAILLENGAVKYAGEPKDVTAVYMKDNYESMQGKSELPVVEATTASQYEGVFANQDYRDMRLDFLNASPLRNDIKVFRFNEDGAAFGIGGCTIDNCALTDEKGQLLSFVVGGEMVQLHVLCHAHQELLRPIVGFHFKDRLGQILFGDNTFITYKDAPLHVLPGQSLTACFSFRMPILERGDYAIGTSIAEGSQLEHVQHHWRHETLLLTSISTSLCTGMMGIPMRDISMHLLAK